jgi:threonine/homoserine/homoserine lactone efflux protein
MLGFIVQGIGFGFTAGTSPGPLQTFIISTTLSYGWRRGLFTILAPLITDVPIILTMTFMLDVLPPVVVRIIQFVGGIFLIYLSYVTLKSIEHGVTIGEERVTVPGTQRRTLLQAAGINALSPGPYLFWSTVTGPLLVDALSQSLWHALGLLVGFYGTFLATMASLVFVFDRMRQIDPRFTRIILYVSVVVLAGLGGALIWQSLLID